MACWAEGQQQRSRRLYDPIPSFETALCGFTSIYKKKSWKYIGVPWRFYCGDLKHPDNPHRLNQLGSQQLGSNGVAITSSCVPCSPTPEDADHGWSRKPSLLWKKPFLLGMVYLFLGIHHGCHENRKLLLSEVWWSIVDCRCCGVYDGDGSMVCICDLPSHKLRKHRTNSSRQPAVLGKKVQQIRRFQSSEHMLPCLCHQSSCCLASLTRSFWILGSCHQEPLAIKQKVPKNSKSKNMTPKNV